MQQATPTALQAHADPFRRMVDCAIEYAIVSCDDGGRILTWSEGASRLFGWTEAEMVGQPMQRLFTAEDVAARVFEHECERARAQARASDERWHLRKSGERFWASGELMRLPAQSGLPAGFVKVVRDRTGQRREDAARRQMAADLAFLARASEALADLTDLPATFEKIANLAVSGFAEWSMVDLLEADGSLRRVALAHRDPAQLALAVELQGRTPPDPQPPGALWEVLRSGRAQLVEEMTEDTLQRDAPAPERRQALRALKIHSYILAPLATKGKPLGVWSFATATSGRRYNKDDLELAVDLARRASVAIENATLLKALRENDQAKDVFMATLAHELRNPLAPIWNGLSIIKRVPGERARVEQVTGMIERQVGQLSRLVDDLLDVSRISTGKLELRKVPTSLVKVINSAVEISRPQIEAGHHKLSLTFPDEPAELIGDPERLAQIFSNLLINAAKYTRRGGHLEVTVDVEDTQLVVRVRDNGVGILPEMVGKVFGLFTQVDGSEERRQGGLGIGLSLVQGLVRLHGGRVEAFSEGLDRGSEFVVWLPRRARADLAATPDDMVDRTVPAGPARRILVVDDNLDAAQSVAELLTLGGNEVEVVHDGTGAVVRTGTFRPDVVLLDIGLPDISGYEAARRIRMLEGVRQPLLIALTGWGQEQDKEDAAEAGFDHHWTKPVDPARLMSLTSR